MRNCKMAAPIYFDCKTVESEGQFPKVLVTAEIVVDTGEIHHVNTDEVKMALVKSVQGAVWYRDRKVPRAK